MHDHASRRDFLRTAAAVTALSPAAATLGAVPAAAPRARQDQVAPEAGRLRFGFIGWGIRAREIYWMFLDDPAVDIVSVCDVVDARAKHGVQLVNERRKSDLCRQAADWRAIVADPTLDGVVITTPDHWHAEPAIAACLAGKHVYCEKPLSLTISEGRAIANAARASGVRFQVGSQQRSEYGHMFARAAEAVRNGRIGTVRKITIGVGAPPKACDLPEESLPEGIDWNGWLGQAPMRPFSSVLCPVGIHNSYPAWRNYREYCNGGLADMGAHHFDIAQWALGMDESGPVAVIPPADGAQTGLRFMYANGVEMVHGGPTDCTFLGDKGTIEVSRGHLRAYRGEDGSAPDAPEILAPPAEGEQKLPRNASHVGDFLEAIRTGREPICTAETGHRTASICQLCVIGYEVGKPLTWDPVTERFTGANAADGNALLVRRVRPHH
jgi:predicted dehydrogenase